MTTGRAVTESDIPHLEPFCNSWVVIRKRDGRAICELSNRKDLKRFNADQVTIKTAAQYLAGLTGDTP